MGTSEVAIDMRENYAWYLTPCINPDGYEHSHLNVRTIESLISLNNSGLISGFQIHCIFQDRFWRKNREPNENALCIGTDLNRNWDANWDGKEKTLPSL